MHFHAYFSSFQWIWSFLLNDEIIIFSIKNTWLLFCEKFIAYLHLRTKKYEKFSVHITGSPAETFFRAAVNVFNELPALAAFCWLLFVKRYRDGNKFSRFLSLRPVLRFFYILLNSRRTKAWQRKEYFEVSPLKAEIVKFNRTFFALAEWCGSIRYLLHILHTNIAWGNYVQKVKFVDKT